MPGPFETLRGILREQFGRNPELITPEATLNGTLMLDSLDLVDLVFIIGREFGVQTSLEGLRELRSLGRLAAFIEGRAATSAAVA